MAPYVRHQGGRRRTWSFLRRWGFLLGVALLLGGQEKGPKPRVRNRPTQEPSLANRPIRKIIPTDFNLRLQSHQFHYPH